MKLYVSSLFALLLGVSLVPTSRAFPTDWEHEVPQILTLESRAVSDAGSASGIPQRDMRFVYLVVETKAGHFMTLPNAGRVLSAHTLVAFGGTRNDPPMTVKIGISTNPNGHAYGLFVREIKRPPPGQEWVPPSGQFDHGAGPFLKSVLRLPHMTGLTNNEIFHSTSGEGLAMQVWGEDPFIRWGPGAPNNGDIEFTEKLLHHELMFNNHAEPLDPGIPAAWQGLLDGAKLYFLHQMPHYYREDARLMIFESDHFKATFTNLWPNPPFLLNLIPSLTF